MAVVHVKKRENPYVQIDKRVFEDPRLSWRAKGIMGYLLSKPDGWKVNVVDIWGKGKEGRNAVQDCMSELAVFGYAELVTTHNDQGVFTGKEWVVSEEPKGGFTDATEKPKTEAPKTRKSVFRSISNNELNSNNEEGEEEEKNAPTLPKTFDEMLQRVNAEVSTIEAEKEKISPVPAAPSFSGSDISDEADELKNGVVRRDGPNYEPTDFDFYSKVPLSDMLEDAPVMLVQSFDGQTLPGALVTTVEALNFEHTTRETAATASILKATGREIQCETADDANDLITAWAACNMATIENWYNRSKRVMSAVDLQNIITKFCGTYANHSDSGKRLRFLADPVLFFRNQCSGWLIDQNKFDRDQAAKPNTGKFQQQDNAAAYVAPKAVRPVQTFYE